MTAFRGLRISWAIPPGHLAERGEFFVANQLGLGLVQLLRSTADQAFQVRLHFLLMFLNLSFGSDAFRDVEDEGHENRLGVKCRQLQMGFDVIQRSVLASKYRIQDQFPLLPFQQGLQSLAEFLLGKLGFQIDRGQLVQFLFGVPQVFPCAAIDLNELK